MAMPSNQRRTLPPPLSRKALERWSAHIGNSKKTAMAKPHPRKAGAISPGQPLGVKPPHSLPLNDRKGLRLNARAPRRLARRAVRLVLLVLLLPARAIAHEPLCDWLSGLGESAESLSQGDAVKALTAARRALSARPHGPALTRASAALGLALAAHGEPREAAEFLETALAGPSAPAAAHLAFARGEALMASQQAPAAAREFAIAAAVPDLALSRRAHVRAADALLVSGLAAEAVPEFDAVLRTWPDDAASAHSRLTLGLALRASGNETKAAATLRTLWLERPDTPEAHDAEGVLSSWRARGDPVPAFTGAERSERAERLLAAGWPDETLLELAQAAEAESPAVPSGRANALRAAALLALNRPKEASEAARSVEGAVDVGARRGALLVLARIAAREGRTPEAVALYSELAPLHGDAPGLPPWRQRELGEESRYLAAWLWYDAGDYERASSALYAFAREWRGSRRADDAVWFAAWSLYKLGRVAEAVKQLARLSPGPLADASAYWRGRLATSSTRRRALYELAVREGAQGYYAMLARARLSALGERVAPFLPPTPQALPEFNNSGSAARLSVAVELLGLGMRDLALDELRDLERGPLARQSASLVAQLAAFAKDPELPFVVARDYLASTRRALRWEHPRPLEEALLPTTRALGLDESLVYAVMRRESQFNLRARSSAGARGLLQLRPSTAERVAELLGLPGGASRLDQPDLNLALGAHYLSLLLSRFGNPAVALAAYNAGPTVVENWARTRPGEPLDVWVESIPYRETRDYVKIVVADWNLYRALDGSAPAPLDPAELLRPPGPGVEF